MIKTVKVKKKMKLDELVKYVRENQIGGGHYKEYFSDCMVYFLRINGYKLDYFLKDKTVGLQSGKYPNMPLDTTFTVEVEEEINNTTIFKSVVGVLNDDRIMLTNTYTTIEDIQDKYGTMKEIQAVIDGKLQLIWEAE